MSQGRNHSKSSTSEGAAATSKSDGGGHILVFRQGDSEGRSESVTRPGCIYYFNRNSRKPLTTFLIQQQAAMLASGHDDGCSVLALQSGSQFSRRGWVVRFQAKQNSQFCFVWS